MFATLGPMFTGCCSKTAFNDQRYRETSENYFYFWGVSLSGTPDPSKRNWNHRFMAKLDLPLLGVLVLLSRDGRSERSV